MQPGFPMIYRGKILILWWMPVCRKNPGFFADFLSKLPAESGILPTFFVGRVCLALCLLEILARVLDLLLFASAAFDWVLAKFWSNSFKVGNFSLFW